MNAADHDLQEVVNSPTLDDIDDGSQSVSEVRAFSQF